MRRFASTIIALACLPCAAPQFAAGAERAPTSRPTTQSPALLPPPARQGGHVGPRLSPATLPEPTIGTRPVRPVRQGGAEEVHAPQPESGVTLEEIASLARTRHPALQEATAKIDAAQGSAVQAGLYPNPLLYAASPQWSGSSSQYMVFVGQDFITAGKLRLAQAAARRGADQAQLDLTRVRFEVLTAVRKQFVLTAAQQRRTEVLGQLAALTGRSRDAGEKMREAGEVNRAETTLLDIEHDKARVAHVAAQKLLGASLRQLAATAGVPDVQIGPLAFDLAAPLPDYQPEAVRQGVVDQNALAAIAAVEVEKKQIELRRAEVEPWPNVNVQAGYMYSVEPPLHDMGYAQVALAVPLWNRNQGNIRAAQADAARAAASQRRVEAELSRIVMEALGDYAAASERATVYADDIVPKAKEVFDVNRSLFEQGQTDFLHLLQAQRTLIEADLAYIDAQAARWTAAAIVAGLLQVEKFP